MASAAIRRPAARLVRAPWYSEKTAAAGEQILITDLLITLGFRGS
jgi:hypothetical protein